MSSKGNINGFDTGRLFQTIEAMRTAPSLGKFQFRARNKWIDGRHNRSEISDFYGAGQENDTREQPFVFDNDAHQVLDGEDNGANPLEYILHGLAGCLTTSLVAHAAARGIQIDSVESTYEGDIDLRGFLGITDEVRNGYENIRVKFRIESDAPQETIEELIQIAQQHSPVFDTLTRPVSISVELEKSEAAVTK